MASPNLRDIAEQWLYSTLSTITHNSQPVPVHRHPAPEGSSYPVITVGLSTASDISPIGLGGTLEKFTYDVSAWEEGRSSTSVSAIAQSINTTLLATFPTAIGGGSIVSCRRLGANVVPQISEQGKNYMRDGGTFEVIVANN